MTTWPQSQTREFETLLTSRENAETFLDIVEPLFFDERWWCTMVVGGPEAGAVELWDVVFVQHSSIGYGLTGGKLARVIGIAGGLTGDSVELRLWA